MNGPYEQHLKMKTN